MRKQLREEAPDKRIASTVGVDNVLGINDEHGVLVDLAVVHNNGGVGALGDDDSALLLLVGLHIHTEAGPSHAHVRQTWGSCEIFSAISLTSVVSHLLEAANAAASVSLPNT